LDRRQVWSKMWQFSAPTRFGERYKEAIVNAGNIFLYTYARVTAIETNEKTNVVTQMRVKNHAGKEHVVRANCFVLACCALQNARLLLASTSRVRAGLRNRYGLVGRFFMEHLEVSSSELLTPAERQVKLYMPWSSGNTKCRAELAISEEKQKELKILNGTA